jgi:hypothetical protein
LTHCAIQNKSAFKFFIPDSQSCLSIKKNERCMSRFSTPRLSKGLGQFYEGVCLLAGSVTAVQSTRAIQ